MSPLLKTQEKDFQVPLTRKYFKLQLQFLMSNFSANCLNYSKFLQLIQI